LWDVARCSAVDVPRARGTGHPRPRSTRVDDVDRLSKRSPSPNQVLSRRSIQLGRSKLGRAFFSTAGRDTRKHRNGNAESARGHSFSWRNRAPVQCQFQRVFWRIASQPANEATAFRPRSPYAVAKAAAYWEVANYREAYGLFACSGILFNHESPLRPERFVTKKVVAAATRIAAGSDEYLSLGDLSIERDWGWAPEYVEAMWKMMQGSAPDDFVIATGVTSTLQSFVETAFECLDLDWRRHVRIDASLKRPTDLRRSGADPSKAARLLGWSATLTMKDVVAQMVRAERARTVNPALLP